MNEVSNEYERLLMITATDLKKRAEIRIRNAEELISKGTIAKMLADEDLRFAAMIEGKIASIGIGKGL